VLCRRRLVGLSSLSNVKKFFIFIFSLGGGGKGPRFWSVFAPFPEKGILDYIAHRPITQVLTVRDENGSKQSGNKKYIA